MQLDKIVLKHGKSVLKSRQTASIHVEANGQILASPVVLSNMPCCQNKSILNAFNEEQWPYVYHRLWGYDDVRQFMRDAYNSNFFLKSISIGVQPDDLNFLKSLKEEELFPDWLTIDVALIYNKHYEDYIKTVRELFPDTYLIAGNFTNSEAIEWLKDLGVNCGKFGIGVSKLCRTREYTGFGTTLQNLMDCSIEKRRLDFDIMVDGGLTVLDPNNGEIAIGDVLKLINFGAKWVMSSALFRYVTELSGHTGQIVQYGNSTSLAKGHVRNIEGTVVTHSTHGRNIHEQMNLIKESLQSGVSYSGFSSIEQIQKYKNSQAQPISWSYIDC